MIFDRSISPDSPVMCSFEFFMFKFRAKTKSVLAASLSLEKARYNFNRTVSEHGFDIIDSQKHSRSRSFMFDFHNIGHL